MHHNSHHQFITHDGTTLFYQRWAAAHQPAKKAIVLFHRGHEHSERMAHLVEELNLPDFDFFAWDARGHGQSPGERGDAPSFRLVSKIFNTLCDISKLSIRSKHPISPLWHRV